MPNLNGLIAEVAAPIAVVGLLAGCSKEPNQNFEVVGFEANARTRVYHWEDGEGRLPSGRTYKILGQEVRIECIDKEDDEANFWGGYEGDEGCNDFCSGWDGSNCKAREYTHYWYTVREENPEIDESACQIAETANELNLQPIRADERYYLDSDHWSVEQTLDYTVLVDDDGETGDAECETDEKEPLECSIDMIGADENLRRTFSQLQIGQRAVGREELIGLNPQWIEFTYLDKDYKISCD